MTTRKTSAQSAETTTPAAKPARARKAASPSDPKAPTAKPPAAPKIAKPTVNADDRTTLSIRDRAVKDPTENERAMYAWACRESGIKFDQASFIAGRRLQGDWQRYNREHRSTS